MKQSRFTEEQIAFALKQLKEKLSSVPELGRKMRVSCYTFWHTAINRLVAAGIDLWTVMQWSGHRRLETLQKYAHLAPGFLDKIKGKLEYHI